MGIYVGMIAFATLYPLDNIRTRLQVQGPFSSEDERKVNEIEDKARTRVMYANGWDCAIKTIRHEGWQALYNGLSSGVLGVGVSSCIYFWWYYLLKRLALRTTRTKSLSPLLNIIVATLAGIINISLTTPIWVINTRMTLQEKRGVTSGCDGTKTEGSEKKQDNIGDKSTEADVKSEDKMNKVSQYTGMIATCRAIIQHEGWLALYRGFIPSLVLVANPAVQFVVYDQLSRFITSSRTRSLLERVRLVAQSGQSTAHLAKQGSLTATEAFVLGAFAKAVATILTYPYQVVKSRQQADCRPLEQVPSLTALVQDMYQTEGISVFARGIGTKLSQTVSNAAFAFLIYNQIVVMIDKLRRRILRTA